MVPSIKYYGVCLLFALMLCSKASSHAAARSPAPPICALSLKAMPESWRPDGTIYRTLSQQGWSAEEKKEAAAAVSEGLGELSEYFEKHPDAVSALGTNAVESLIDASYAAGNMPELRSGARAQARRVLSVLTAPVLPRDAASEACGDLEYVMMLTSFAQILYPPGSAETGRLVGLTNASARACGSLGAALGYDYREKLSSREISVDEAWDLVMWSIRLIDAQSVPGLELPSGARMLPEDVWRFYEGRPFAGAAAYPDRANNDEFYRTAYLATHLAYIPTGYGRYRIYIADSPALYEFLRGNFYAVLELRELDLVAEFVDLFRQYGCTERNDLQVRDGTRYLLKLFHAAGERWMAHREPYEEKEVSQYDAIHKVWTGMAGVRERVPEHPEPRSYGAVVRAWLGYPR